MKRIGIIVAMKEEFEALYDKIGKKIETIYNGNREIYFYKRKDLDIYVTDTAEGEIQASSMTQYLITKFDIDLILNFGLCGSLNPKYKCKDLVVIKEMVHYDFDITSLRHDYIVGQYFGQNGNVFYADKHMIDKVMKIEALPLVKVASADKFVGDNDFKRKLIDEFNADICEMESAGIMITAKTNNVPCLLIKCISDNAGDEAHMDFNDIVSQGIDSYVELIIKFLDSLAK